MQLKMDIKASSITQISDTRWVCRYKNCKAVKDNFEVILEVLTEEIDANSNLDVAQAIGISVYYCTIILYELIIKFDHHFI